MKIKKLILIVILASLSLTTNVFAGKYGWAPCFKNEIEFPKETYLLNLGMTHLESKDGYRSKMISQHHEHCDIGFNNEGYRIEDITIWDMESYQRFNIQEIPKDCAVVQKEETISFYGKYDSETKTIKNLRCSKS